MFMYRKIPSVVILSFPLFQMNRMSVSWPPLRQVVLGKGRAPHPWASSSSLLYLRTEHFLLPVFILPVSLPFNIISKPLQKHPTKGIPIYPSPHSNVYNQVRHTHDFLGRRGKNIENDKIFEIIGMFFFYL